MNLSKKLVSLMFALILSISSFVFVYIIFAIGLDYRIQNGVYDEFFKIVKHGDSVKTEKVGIVAIDDLSLNNMNNVLGLKWPWPRQVYGMVTQWLIDAGAKGVVFDIMMDNGDSDLPLWGINGFDSDYSFYEVISNTGKVVLPINIENNYFDKDPPTMISENNYHKILERFEGNKRKDIASLFKFSDGYDFYFIDFNDREVEKKFQTYKNDLAITIKDMNFVDFPDLYGADKFPYVREYKYVHYPYSLFTINNNKFGFVEIEAEIDGVIREYKPFVKINGKYVPSLAISAYCLSHGNLIPPGINIKDDGRFHINWYGPGYIKTDENANLKKSTLPYYSFWHIFEMFRQEYYDGKTVNKSVFKDKMLFIGSTSRGDFDQKMTPLTTIGNIYPGVEIHATSYLNFVNNDYLRELPLELELLLYFIVSFFIIFFIIGSESTRKGIGILIIFTIFVVSVQFLLFWKFNLLFKIVFFVFLNCVSGISAFSLNYAMVGRNRNLIKKALGTYISPALEREITESGAPIGTTGEKVVGTVMFVDIAGFTTFSEQNEVEHVVKTLNVYLEKFSDVILSNSGFVNKFLGDGLMASFGTLIPTPNHADLALKSALECIDICAELHKEHALDIRIGINSGDMIKGNLGGEKRLEFTTIGDNVNLASRLEGVNKFFSTRIIIGENTFDLLEDIDKSKLLFLGNVIVKGKEGAIDVYTAHEMNEDISIFKEMVLAVKNNNDEEVKNKFYELSKKNSQFGPYLFYKSYVTQNNGKIEYPIVFTEK